jgi:DNA (cytosine-5)-methyltransferase 1
MNSNLPKSLDDIDFRIMNTFDLVDEVKLEMKAILTHYAQTIGNGYSHTFETYSRESLKEYCAKIINDLPTHEQLDSILKLFKDEATNVPFPPPEDYAFTFIDLFAGIGGFRLAMQNLGGKCVFSSEWDKEAQKTYRANFGEVPFGDITKDSTKRFIPDGIDILCAGFPCQAFSIAGKRGGFEDTRGTLFFDVAEIIKSKQPKAIFLENVKGLRNHDRGKTLETILNVLREDLGYFVPDPQIINAKDFGVPQNRERIFIVGFRKDLNIEHFEYPKPLTKRASFADIKEKNVVSTKYYLSDRYLSTLKDHKKRHAEKGNGFGYEVIPDHGISNAVVCGGMGRERNLVYDDRIVDFTPVTRIHGEVNKEGIRKMTPREWARLQGFPDTYIVPVADASAYKQFGNSVAVPAIQATGNEIVKIIRVNNDQRQYR